MLLLRSAIVFPNFQSAKVPFDPQTLNIAELTRANSEFEEKCELQLWLER